MSDIKGLKNRHSYVDPSTGDKGYIFLSVPRKESPNSTVELVKMSKDLEVRWKFSDFSKTDDWAKNNVIFMPEKSSIEVINLTSIYRISFHGGEITAKFEGGK